MSVPECKVMTHKNGYVPLYKKTPSAKWAVLQRNGRPDFHQSAHSAMTAARVHVGLESGDKTISACPMPANHITPEQRAFYDRKAEQMANSYYLAKRRKTVIVEKRDGTIIKKIGVLK